jgi:hypothetical protein
VKDERRERDETIGEQDMPPPSMRTDSAKALGRE